MKNIDDVHWDSDWGTEPVDKSKRADNIKQRLAAASKLIPIFGHRYLVVDDNKTMPVLSIVGLDIVYYGEDLFDYFFIEAGIKRQQDMDFTNIEPVIFWGDDIY